MFWLAPRTRFRIYTQASDYLNFFRDILTGKTASGDDCERLEKAIAERVGVPHALCVPQARVGIYLAIKSLIRPGQKVVLSPYTIADVINMVLAAGGVPVFGDIDRSSTNITAAEIERLIDGETGAVMVTHLHGIACEIREIAALCKAKGIPLIEDTAQCFGGKVDGKALGAFGDFGIYSFGMYKNVTAFYGGMLVANNSAAFGKARDEWSPWPMQGLPHLLKKVRKALFTDIVTAPLLFSSSVYWIFRFGFLHDVWMINKLVTIELDTSRKEKFPDSYRCKFLPMQARMVLRQLESLDGHSATRIGYSRIYFEGLKGLPGLILPPFKDDGTHIYNYFPIQYRDRQALLKWMMKHRRDLAAQHLKNCAGIEAFRPEYRDCKNAEQTSHQVILLPNYPTYGEAQVRKNIAVIRAFFESGPGKERT